MDIKQLKKALGLNNSDIAEFFGLSPNGYANSSAKKRYENALCKFYYFLMDREKNGMSLSELQSVVNEKLPIQRVVGMLLSDYAKEKLEYINGSCIVRDFPKEQPTKEWAGAVLDLLEDMKLGNNC